MARQSEANVKKIAKAIVAVDAEIKSLEKAIDKMEAEKAKLEKAHSGLYLKRDQLEGRFFDAWRSYANDYDTEFETYADGDKLIRKFAK